MTDRLIENLEELETNSNRKLALSIATAGLNAINTEEAIFRSIKLEGDTLRVAGESFDLSKFKNIKVVGFGKSSASATLALEKVLGSKIKEGAVIGINKVNSNYVETFVGTHPRPSEVNISAGNKIYEIAKNSNEDDLIIVLVSGGGSALLCYGENECDQGIKLYDSFLKTGKTISEINTVRKHLSVLKGGGLAKLAYPATLIGLIFSDIPGDKFENVASGPTYKDDSTADDAKKIVLENDLGDFTLVETPKEDKYFEKVHNFVLVSNKIAVEAMVKKGEELGFKTKVVSTELYDETSIALSKIFSAKEDNSVVLAAGEPRIEVIDKGGKGGRNLHMGLLAVRDSLVDGDSVFISLASDGIDNSDVAGAVVDKETIQKVEKLGLVAEDYLNRFDSYNFFKQTGDCIITGPTGANVSDLMILVNKKNE
jgi:glycerate-2-kinase